MTTKKIDKQHKLPCDFTVAHLTFRKGVQLETVRQAAERWFKAAREAQEDRLDREVVKNLRINR